LVAATDVVDTAYFSHTTAVANNGGGAAETDSATTFPKGTTIFGRFEVLAIDSGKVIAYKA